MISLCFYAFFLWILAKKITIMKESLTNANLVLFLKTIVSAGALAVSVSNGENGMVLYIKLCYLITSNRAPALVPSVIQTVSLLNKYLLGT